MLLHGNAQFPKTQLEKRVFAPHAGRGHPHLRGRELALAAAHGGAAVPPCRSFRAGADHDEGRRGPGGALAHERSGAVHAIDRDMTETTFHVISATMFAGSADAEAAAILKSADTALATISWDIAAAMLRLPAWMWYPGKFKRRRAARTLRAAVATILARRRAAGLEGDDLLARLARAQDPETGEPMSEKQLVDNLVTFLAAGHETTAKALTWTLYLARPRAAVAGAHPRRDRRRRRQRKP